MKNKYPSCLDAQFEISFVTNFANVEISRTNYNFVFLELDVSSSLSATCFKRRNLF